MSKSKLPKIKKKYWIVEAYRTGELRLRGKDYATFTTKQEARQFRDKYGRHQDRIQLIIVREGDDDGSGDNQNT